MGLDHTCKPDLWHVQERQLKDLLAALDPAKVLKLHLRGMKDNPTGVEVFMRCLDVISPLLRGGRKIQLHCFTSTAEGEWLESFPNINFSYTNMVSRFNSRQRVALKAVPRNRPLLETDAPYFAPKGRTNGAPSLLAAAAEDLGGHRKS